MWTGAVSGLCCSGAFRGHRSGTAKDPVAAAASAQVVLLFPLALLVRTNAAPGAAAAAGLEEAWKRARTALPEAPAKPLLALAKHLLAESSSSESSDEGNRPPPPESPVLRLLRLIEAEATAEAPQDTLEPPAQPMNHHLSPSPLPKAANEQHRGGPAAAPRPDAPTDPLGPSLPAPAPSSGPRQLLLGSSGSAALIDVVVGGGGDPSKGQQQQKQQQEQQQEDHHREGQQREERGNGGPGGLAGAAPLSAATLLGPARGAHGQMPPPLCQTPSPRINDPSLLSTAA